MSARISCLLVSLSLILGPGCASRGALRGDGSAFTARDYLRTAWNTLIEAETDTAGHRVRAQRETRAALEALNELTSTARVVPFEGPPTLAVALELLQHSEAEIGRRGSPAALEHTRRAEDELKAALASK
jgi:hypothetical protein